MKTNQTHFFCKWTIVAPLVLLSILIAACSSTSTPASAPQSSAPPIPPPASAAAPASGQRQGGNSASGALASISGNTLTLTTPQGQATVIVSPTTVIQKTVTGTLADFTAGQSLVVTGTPDSSGNIAATIISIRPQGQDALFTPRGADTPNPSRSPNGSGTGTFPGASGNPAGRGYIGTLTAINGSTLTITTAQPSTPQITVTVGSNTAIDKTVSGTLADLTVGSYLNVFGTADSNGQINAISITDRPPGQVNGFAPIGG